MKRKHLELKEDFQETGYLDTVGVAGSIPVEPTILSPFHASFLREIRDHEEGIFIFSHRKSLIFTVYHCWRCEKGVNGRAA